jgi:hypothetical protein
LIGTTVGVGVSVLSLIIGKPLEKRLAKWREKIDKSLMKLEEEKVIHIESLSENENFITVITQATLIALRNHQQEKLEALQNAVLNSALSNNMSEDNQLMFLNYIDIFTPWHLKILHFFNKRKDGGLNNDKKSDMAYWGDDIKEDWQLEKEYPELKGKKEFYNVIINDLSGRGLIDVSMPRENFVERAGDPDPDIYNSYTSDRGRNFLDYIMSQVHRNS